MLATIGTHRRRPSRVVSTCRLACGLALFLALGTAVTPSASSGAAPPQLSAPEINFEHLWQTFDRNYGIFGPKKVDWDALYALYRPRVDATTTDDELFDIMSNLLGHLNDNHVRLSSEDRSFRSGILGQLEMDDFSLDLVKEKYLGADYEQRVEDVFTYGWLTDSIGYFHFRSFGNLEASTAAIDEIIAELANADAIVVDVRSNGGGSDRVGKLIADRFADRRRLYMITSIRNGPNHDDFSAPRYWNVEPNGPIQFTRPVILLTHRHSISAAENFALAMRVLPHVTVLGETTSGVFADVYRDTLPNGWRFSVSYKLFVDYTGFCWEGLGVPPDIRQINTAEEIQAGRDKVLELAIDLSNTGALARQDERPSAEAARRSLVRELREAIGERGIDAAIGAFDAAKLDDPDTYYMDREEMELLAEELLAADRLDDAIRLLELNAREFGDSWEVHDSLADAYVRAGNTAAARASFQRARALNRRSYPWEITAYEKATEFLEEQAPEFVAPLQAFVREVMDAFEVPGVAVGVVRGGSLAYAGAFGVRSVEAGEPLRPEHVFHMASVSKPFVATAIMQLVERGEMSLDDRVTDYLPYFKLGDDAYSQITIRQMLNHTSGMPDVEDYEWDRPQLDAGAAERYVRSLRNEKMIASPGELFRYSNMAFDTLGDMIAKVSGQSFESYMKENILDPLGMSVSTFFQPDVPERLRTTGHVGRDGPVVSAHYPYNRRHAPSSTLNSNVVEMANWALANLNRGELEGRRILSSEGHEVLWTPTVETDGRAVGLSWFLSEHRGRARIYHGGSDTGFRSHFTLLPEEDLGLVVASNYSGTPMNDLAEGILDILLGYEPTVPDPSIR